MMIAGCVMKVEEAAFNGMLLQPFFLISTAARSSITIFPNRFEEGTDRIIWVSKDLARTSKNTASTSMNPFGIVTSTSSSNASIDRVVFQIERLSGQINVLTYQIDGAVATIEQRGAETIASISNNFNNDTIENVKRMLHIISEKTHEWPVTALIVVGITALILIVITFLFLMAKGGEKIVERRYNQKIPIQDHDIEGL